jgi:hypothetical protein
VDSRMNDFRGLTLIQPSFHDGTDPDRIGSHKR